MRPPASPRATFLRYTVVLIFLILLAGRFLGIRFVQISTFFHPEHRSIAGLRNASGRVELQGIVTYVDSDRKRFWIQDESGAIQLNSSGQNIEPRQLVRIKGRVAQNPGSTSEVALASLVDVRVIEMGERRVLPAPVPVSLQTSVQRDFGGLRIQLAGVLRAATREASGRTIVTFGDAPSEAVAVLPANFKAPLLNSVIQVTGVAEGIAGESGLLRAQRLWVQDPGDLRVLSEPPASDPVHSIRSLFADASTRDGHRVRMRVRVVPQSRPTSANLEDNWGAVRAEFDEPPNVAPGSLVEVTGFPRFFGFQLEIQHARVASAPGNTVPIRADGEEVLRSAAAVHRLAPARAKAALPVRVDGVVTFADESWQSIFVQDSTGGIYVPYSIRGVNPRPGDRVTVIGLSHVGDYAPVIVAPKLIARGRTKLPRPVQITPRDASSGRLDSVFVEVEGVVHAFANQQDPTHLAFSLYSPFGPIRVLGSPRFSTVDELRKLDDATAAIRGICGTIFNSRRQLVGYQLLVTSIHDIKIKEPPNPNPFELNATPINELLQYSPDASFNHRVRVSGIVTMVGQGFFYIEDESGGMRVEGNSSDVRAGGFVEAAGYATPGAYSPVLREAVVRAAASPAHIDVKPIKLDWNATANSDSRLVTVEGRVLSVVTGALRKNLVLESGGRIFDAQLYLHTQNEAAPLLEEGSVLRLTGISSSQADSPSSYLLDPYTDPGVRILIRSPQDIEVVKSAPWWSLRHTILVVGALLSVILAGLVWLHMMRRRMLQQQTELRRATEKAQAVHQLAHAMQEVTQRRDFSARVEVTGGHDISLLSAEFNKMIGELHARDLEKAEVQKRLQQQALTDELTGLPNRRLFSDRLYQTLEAAKRDAGTIGLLYIDLDGFKLVNDSLGHSIGDILLSRVAERLRSRTRKSDTLARLGGDEFALVLSRLRNMEEAGVVARSLLEAIAAPFLVSGHEINISASIGVSVYPQNSEDASLLLQQADSAMYTAKRNGKNQIVFFTPDLGVTVRERLNLENQLRGAIARREIDVHYQPEFDVETRQLVRFEALARWTHPTLGSIPPAKFIPVAEETGLIIPLGTYILERACKEATRWQTISSYPVQVAVNVSSVQFARESFVAEVAEVLRHTGLAPSLLQIELTESVMLNGAGPAATTMQRLRALGVSIAIDDFGTGYSCFGYLPRLPFNALKIDRGFVKELGTTAEMNAMVRSLVTLAHNLNMQVIAEGVETPEQLEIIKNLGGNQVQGFLLGLPTPDPASQLRGNNPAESQPGTGETSSSAAGGK